MSGSILSLLANPDNAFCNRELYDYHQRVTRKSSYKELKNQSNYVRQNLEHSFEHPIPDSFMEFSKDLQFPYRQQYGTANTELNDLNRCIKRRSCEGRLSHHPVSNIDRNTNTSPKIVGVERKKNINYKPIYMQRHSVALGEGLTNLTEEQYRNYERIKLANSSKRSLIVEAIAATPVIPPTHVTEDVKPKEAAKTGFLFSVKDRISFFNKLATLRSSTKDTTENPKPKAKFLSLLRQKEPTQSKTSIILLSQLVSRIYGTGKSDRMTPQEFTIKPTDSSTNRSCVHVFKFGTHSLPTPIKRKPSFEKTKTVTSSISKCPNSSGTNPRRHNLMEDLSLVVPVRLRIAEFEKRISTTQT